VIDPLLFDLLHRLKTELAATQPFQVISGYRCPATNATLRATPRSVREMPVCAAAANAAVIPGTTSTRIPRG